MPNATVAAMEADLLRRGVRFTHLTATHRQAIEAERLFAGFYGKTFDRYDAQFFDARITGASRLHTPVLVLEDRENMNQAALSEALLIAAPEGDIAPAIIEVLV